LKPERWGSSLVQEKYQEEKACDKRHPYHIIIIIIIMTTTNIHTIYEQAVIGMFSPNPYLFHHFIYTHSLRNTTRT